MTMNINTLVPGGVSLTFGEMSRLQAIAAQMEIEELQCYQDVLPLMQTLNKEALKFAKQQARDQITQGWLMFGSGMGQAVALSGSAIGGAMAANSATTAGEMEVNRTYPPEVEVGAVRAVPTATAASGGAAAGGPVGAVQLEIAAEVSPNALAPPISAESAPPTAAPEETAKAAADRAAAEEGANKIRERAASTASMKMNLANQIVAPTLSNIFKSGFDAAGGYNQARITKDQALAQYASNSIQTVTTDIGAINAFTQGQDGKEQAAASAMVAMIQVSSPM